jgi:hypothetical protein
MHKTYHEIGRADKLSVLDKISHKYVPQVIEENEAFKLRLKEINFVLFKAERVDEYFTLDRVTRDCYKYYAMSKFNNLETFIGEERITRVDLRHHSHLSWRWDKKEIEKMGSIIKSYIG